MYESNVFQIPRNILQVIEVVAVRSDSQVLLPRTQFAPVCHFDLKHNPEATEATPLNLLSTFVLWGFPFAYKVLALSPAHEYPT